MCKHCHHCGHLMRRRALNKSCKCDKCDKSIYFRSACNATANIRIQRCRECDTVVLEPMFNYCETCGLETQHSILRNKRLHRVAELKSTMMANQQTSSTTNLPITSNRSIKTHDAEITTKQLPDVVSNNGDNNEIAVDIVTDSSLECFQQQQQHGCFSQDPYETLSIEELMQQINKEEMK